LPEVKAVAREVGASTKRLRPIVDLVRGKPVNVALDTLG
jgi:ribosomal protein L22